MPQDAAVAEAERLERADLRLFVDGKAVHRRDHGQNRDQKEDDRQQRAHGLALLGLALRAGIGKRLVAGQNQRGFSKRGIRRLDEFFLVQIGQDVDLRIIGNTHGLFVKHR